MGEYSVPESIRKFKPKGTMVKRIAGKYYVYEYSCVKGDDGKRHTKMGKAIGSIKEGIGYVPNNNLLRDDEVSALEYGEYALSLTNSKKTLKLLKECFNPEDAIRIYTVALIHFIQGFTYMKDLKDYYDMSILSVKYPSLKLGYDSLSGLYENLGRRQKSVMLMEEKLIASSSGQLAIDGHVIASCSTENDLAEKGYKFQKLGESQMNLLMAYDVNTGIPLLSRIYSGSSADKVSVKDFLNLAEMKDLLFVIDRGFYSSENLNLFSSNGNAYIIPLSKGLNTCKKAVHSLEMDDRFMYQKGRKASVVEYRDTIIDGYRVITYRDLNEAAAETENYLRHMNTGNKSYTKEGFEKAKYYVGVTVLQTSLESEKTAEEIYELYKKRWQIETYYNYFKNKAGYATLYESDYYKTQGLSFLMLVSALIHREMEEAAQELKAKGKSVQDCLLEARLLKAVKRHNVWTTCNCQAKQKTLFEQLQTPVNVSEWLHT